MILAAAIAVPWVLAYIVAGWWGVGFMALLGLIGEVVLVSADALAARRQRAIAQRRWDAWYG